ncbi:MAG TPA: hypothetical protein PKA51_00960, partial [Kiritimatiellia bacterium]|nr:hypothetical protein [Kiritimatiellia bacterium]
GLEPTTLALTAPCSTIELLRKRTTGEKSNGFTPNVKRSISWMPENQRRPEIDIRDGLNFSLVNP